MVAVASTRHRGHPGAVSRGVWAALIGWTAVWAWLRAQPSGISWHFFPLGAQLMFHGPGLHLYAEHPELQIGPLTFLVTLPLTWLPAGSGLVCGQILMTAVLPLALAVIAPLVDPPRRGARILLAGLVLAPTWTVLSVRWGHLDDALALLLLCVAVRAARDDRAVLAGLALALAAGAKPWAVLGLPLLLLLSHRRGQAVATATIGTVLAWAPFLIADAGTLAAFRPPVGVSDSSTLSLVGYHGTSIPGWDRAAQLLLAPLAGLISVRRGAWAAALLCGIAVRLALDPQDIAYYAAGATLAAAAFDLLGTRWRIPWTTLLTAAVFWQPFVTDYAARLQLSHGASLWWFEHPHVVAASHLLWAVTALTLGVRYAPRPASRREASYAVDPDDLSWTAPTARTG